MMIDTKIRPKIQACFDKIAHRIAPYPITPNHLTIIAFLTGIMAAIFIWQNHVTLAIVMLWISGFLDVLDGSLARVKKQSSPYGAFMDLIFDRLVESIFILAFALWYDKGHWVFYMFYIGVIFNFSTFMATGALIPNLGNKSMYYDFGLVERTETFLTFTLMTLFPSVALYVLMIFNVLMFLTGIMRFYRIYQITRREG